MISFKSVLLPGFSATRLFVLVCFSACFTDTLAAVTIPGDYPTIQAALDDLKNGPLPSGEVINVLPGTYYEALTYAEAPKSFTLKSVAGAELTIIDATGTDRSTVFIRDTAANIIIDGFTITGGDNRDGGGLSFSNASAVLKNSIVEDNYGYHGGGMQLFASTSTIDNCIFRNNVASKSAGGITVVNGSHVTILDSKILDNIAGAVDSIASGGGVRLGNSTVIIRGSEISGNHAKFAGGGVFAIGEFDSAYGETSLTIEDSLVSGNSVIHDTGYPIGAGGGVHIEANVSAFVTNSVIVDNISSGKGGGLNTFQANFEIVDTLIEYNQALAGTGGGIHGFSEPPYASTALVTNSVVRNNVALNAGGISMGGNGCGTGGVCAGLTLDNTLIDSNVANFYGGGINLDNADLTSLNSQVLRNSVTDASGGTGGGFRMTVSMANIYNTSISGNYAEVSGGGIYVGSTTDIIVDASKIYANAVEQADKGGGIHTSSAGPPQGSIKNSVIADNLGFQIREQSCPPELPSPILSYFDNNINNDPHSTLYKSPCLPPEEVYDIGVFNALSPGEKTYGNYDSPPDFSVFSGNPLPQGGSVLAWTQANTDMVDISNLGTFPGPVGTVDILPACTTTYWLGAAPITVLGTNAAQLNIMDQKLRGNKIIEASDNIRIEKTIISSGAEITLKAGTGVVLSQEFALNLGGTLHVQIDANLCGGAP